MQMPSLVKIIHIDVNPCKNNKNLGWVPGTELHQSLDTSAEFPTTEKLKSM